MRARPIHRFKRGRGARLIRVSSSMPALLAEIRGEAQRSKTGSSRCWRAFNALAAESRHGRNGAELRSWTRATWERIEGAEAARDHAGFSLGIDLGQNAAMSRGCCLLAFERSARIGLRRVPRIAKPKRAGPCRMVSGNLYARMADRGEILQAGRRVSDVGALLSRSAASGGASLTAVLTCDRWREAELRQALEAVVVPVDFAW